MSSTTSSNPIPTLNYAPAKAAAPRDARQPLPPLAPDGRMSPRVLWGTAALITALYAALWSTHWYPLSDSSLYFRMAKGLAAGEPIDFIRQVHRSIRPMTPLMLSWVIKAGGGIGTMHVLMIAFMLASLGLMFGTMRNWFNERVAFWSTLLTAMSWWFFSNATTVMTEPPFLAFFWGSLYAFSNVRRTNGVGRQWALVVLGTFLLWLAWCNRVAAIFFVPGIVAGLFFTTLNAAYRTRVAWCALVSLVFGVAFLDYMKKAPPAPPDGKIEVERGGGALVDVGDPEGGERGYRWNWLVGVSNPVIQLPVQGGRWVLEVMAAGLYFPHKSPSVPLRVAGGIVAFAAFVLLIVGWYALLRRGHWWAAGLAIYFVPLWIMWGTRVKPRYMIPIAPILWVILWTGIALGARWLLRRRAATAADPAGTFTSAARWALATMFVVSLGLNGFAYGVEVYIRYGTKEKFYDVARQGWNAEIIDICSYVKKRTGPEAVIWLNRGAHRRMIGLLADRRTRQVRPERLLKTANDTEGFADVAAKMMEQRWTPPPWMVATPAKSGGKKGKAKARTAAAKTGATTRAANTRTVAAATSRPTATTGPATSRPTTGPSGLPPQYLIAYYEEPAWPRFHWPLKSRPPEGSPARWWQLFLLDETTGTLKPVHVDHDDTSMRHVLNYEPLHH